jgi:hypothetical protein
MGAKSGDKDWYGYCVDDPVNRVDVWGLESEGANSGDKPYYCRWSNVTTTGRCKVITSRLKGAKTSRHS